MAGHDGQTRWSTDAMVLRDGSVFSYGWCVGRLSRVTQLDLVLDFEDGRREFVPTQYGLSRTDVAAKFPGSPEACGFFVNATLSSAGAVRAIMLRVRHEDGLVEYLVCAVPEPEAPAESTVTPIAVRLWASWVGSVPFAVRLIGRGDWRGVLAGMWRKLKSSVQLLGARESSDDRLQKLFNGLRNGATLVLDHSLGGGANQFCDGLVAEIRSLGRDVVLWRFIPHLLRHELTVFSADRAPGQAVYVAWDAWKLLLESGKISEVAFNNCVGYTHPERVSAMLVAFRRDGQARLRVYLHDFYLVCPSHFLLDFEGRYCGVPSLEKCRSCLPRITDSLAGLFVSRDIDLWRQGWGDLLRVADEIVHFSVSSRELLSRAYPTLREEQWVLRPHQIEPSNTRFCYSRDAAAVRVAVVGHIGQHKGSAIVIGLAREAAQRNLPVEIIVIGTLEATDSTVPITCTGSYLRGDLPRLLCEYRIHLALMPSICPETFSYVTHELIALGVPLICFNIGAQAEAVARYDRGRVVPFCSGSELLPVVQQFKIELDSLNLP